MNDVDDFDDFLAKVNRVGELVRNLKTALSPDEVESASREADLFLRNKNDVEPPKINMPSKETSSLPGTNNDHDNKDQSSSSPVLDNRPERNLHEMSAEEFIKTVSLDAKMRSRERRDRKSCSDVYKKEANIAFRSGDHSKALQLYDKAIEEVRDSCVLFTNRALTQLHLGCHGGVLSDCKAALRINPASLKALVYKARAHRALGQHELAEACTQEAANLHPHHKAFIRHAVLKESLAPDN